MRSRRVREIVAVVAALGVAVTAMIWFFDRIPIEATSLGWDWRGLWQGIAGGRIAYGNATGLRIAPWSVILILPLGFLSFRSSWAIISLVTLAALVLSIPRTRNRWAFIGMGLVLCSSFTSLRHTADGNFEGIVILGALLTLYSLKPENPWALAAGLLLTTTKVQDAWLFAPVALLCAILLWPRRKSIQTLVVLGVVGIISLGLLGRDWVSAVMAIQERGREVDMSLWATLSRLGIPWAGSALLGMALLLATVVLGRPSAEITSREQAGLLISAALMLSPYSSGNSLLTPLAIGAIALIPSAPWLGIGLFVMDDVKYFASEAMMFRWGPSYATLQTAAIWACLAWWLIRRRRPTGSSVAVESGIE
jgi:hypothetical protein